MTPTDLLLYAALALLVLAALGAIANWVERPRPDSTNRRDARRRGARPNR